MENDYIERLRQLLNREQVIEKVCFTLKTTIQTYLSNCNFIAIQVRQPTLLLCSVFEALQKYTFTSIHKSKANMATYGNILLGGIPGALIDGGSGKGYDYPNYIINGLVQYSRSISSSILTTK